MKIIDLSNPNKQPFTRKVVVVAYYLEEKSLEEKSLETESTPHFLFTVISPKQPLKVVSDWEAAKRYRLPSGYSLIKGTAEILHDGEISDIPPTDARYFKALAQSKNNQQPKVKGNNPSLDDIVYPVITALNEAKEEGGIKVENISMIFDFGVTRAKLDGRNMNVHHLAMELKKPKNAKAIDSLAIEYFTLREMRLAIKHRTIHNIPLIRPSHGRFVEQTFSLLKKYYQLERKKLSIKDQSKNKEKRLIKNLSANFLVLIKKAKKGKFKSHKHNRHETIQNIIEKSHRNSKK